MPSAVLHRIASCASVARASGKVCPITGLARPAAAAANAGASGVDGHRQPRLAGIGAGPHSCHGADDAVARYVRRPVREEPFTPALEDHRVHQQHVRGDDPDDDFPRAGTGSGAARP